MAILPPELVPLIIPDRATSLALALVNKHYNNIVTPTLYKKVTLQRCNVFKAFSETMVAGRPFLREYPTLLHILHWPGLEDGADPDYLKPTIKEILMHIPNLKNLRLTVKESMNRYLIEAPRYPFKLRQLTLMPIRDTIFVDFLKTQPEIEEVVLWGQIEPSGRSRQYTGHTSLQPDILPRLRSIHSDNVNVSFMVPYHPVTKINVSGVHRDFDIHEMIAKSLVPLESLTECIGLSGQPWESGIVSRCFPSLEFCWISLSEYSLRFHLAGPQFYRRSVLSLLKERDTPSYGLDIIRNGLSVFSALRKFKPQLLLSQHSRPYS
ncbi:hypothetical protein RSOL_460170 [Rhizoctonia solani AG-3 Rhs1AP]|uniref:F-box domain-containing protein n=1 Tax=Rhizoctonia solani AG-3 Rhs1AP TaxID=1086054 RepID=X8JIR6_9AGAM|nr:hypothetical protein RSOL_460170 [Rhizoctonia solani AG-3 Rhs1AP]